uniref:Ferredoxin--nitrite reductase, chloroplastic n=1 Tax=Oryza barthii TaxID=65489 RepID=A0A0D3ENN2_9ORYZ
MASSASLQRFLPPYPHAAASRCRPPGVRARPVQSSTVSAPSSSTPTANEAMSAERLEPRVEQREGRYWVLKEKYRTGLNPQEKVKLGKEPMSLFMEGGIKELAKMPMEEIEADKLSKEDIDVRLKWLGLFHRRKHQYGRFMMRLKLPNGVTTSEQTRYLASVIEAYGKEGCADVTTRQNWQIRGVTLPDVPAILDGLNAVGLTSLQSGMDNVRNPVGNPLAGIDPDEIGMEAFRSEVEKRMPNGVLERAAPDDLIDKKWQRRDYLGVHPQKQEGMSYVGLHVPVGRVQAADMFELARLADEYGSGELRLTVEQNIVIPNVKNEKVEALLAEPLLQKFSPQPSLLLKGLVACTGNQFCGQAIIETKQRALLVTSQVEKLVSVPRAVRMHWTGCPNSCGQVQVADIGFMGCLTKDSTGKIVEAADIFVGGRVGSDSHLAGAYKKSVPCDELAPIVADILVERFGAVRREREEDEE